MHIFITKKLRERKKFVMKTPEKIAQEQRSLLNVNDFFKKIIIVGDNIKKSRYENGIIIMSIYGFLLDFNSLNY